MGCDTSVSGSAHVKGGNHQQVQWDVTVNVVLRFLARADTVPQYSIIAQGYPYNRLLLKASLVHTDYSGDAPVTTITPMQLNVGTQIPITIAVGGDIYSYTATIATISNLPTGTCLVDAPGVIQDVQASLLANPGADVKFFVPGSSTGGNKLLPSAGSIYTDGSTGSTDINLDMSSSDAVLWANLQTEPLIKPGPVQVQ